MSICLYRTSSRIRPLQSSASSPGCRVANRKPQQNSRIVGFYCWPHRSGVQPPERRLFVSPGLPNGPDRLTCGLNHLTHSFPPDSVPVQRRRPRRCFGCRNKPATIGSTRIVRIQRNRAFAFLPSTSGATATGCGSTRTGCGPRRRSAARKSRDDRRPGSFNAFWAELRSLRSLRPTQDAWRRSTGARPDPCAEACRVGDPSAGIVMIMRPTPVASTDRDSRSRAGAAPRRPSAGVVVVRRDGPLQRGTGGRRRATVDTELPDGPVPLGIAAGAHPPAAVLPIRCCPEPPDARRRERRGAEPPVTGPLRNGLEWSWR